ncbi:unnamed protein product [Rotaria magnacalcarata]|uniref:Reverse transcriptase domain-containing protein n=3 Tax=Rotaria magnacalcarata TaxID=392030 RepID=A0A816GF43_9BILA|nr:unnamed protein product [Rotaria magnacalcarata]CAF2017454.1 unnamed protein product [Rotaria magnacalcarata]CAF4084558.1 unnamed protein product [Rotaria magnacalcarata]
MQEWTMTPTLDSLLENWNKHREKTMSMLNVKHEISFLLLNVSSLNMYLLDVFKLIDSVSSPIVVLTGTHHDDSTVRLFSTHFSNLNVYSTKGSNAFGGVLVAVHKSIPVKRVSRFSNVANLIVLEIGVTGETFQLVACYSPPCEPLPLLVFDEIFQCNSNTIIMGDLNAKHVSWSKSVENHKGRSLYAWLCSSSCNFSLETVNKFISTSTRSNATIDLILAPPHMFSTSFAVLPSIGSDHYPVVWYPSFKMSSLHVRHPVKRTYWSLLKRFLTFTTSYWITLGTSMTNSIEFFSLYERFLSLIAARLTFVSFCKSFKPSLSSYLNELIERKRYCLKLFRKFRHPYFAIVLRTFGNTIRKELFLYKRQSWQNYCKSLNELDTRSFWRKAKRLFSICTPPIEGFIINNNIVSLPMEMCTAARNFYEEQFSKHQNTKAPIEIEAAAVNEKIEDELNNNRPQSPRITFHHIRKAISSLKNKNSAGIDDVSNHILKLLPSGHLQIILSSFNTFACSYQNPAHWHIAKMILLTKTKSGIVTLDETRPISLLPCFSKIYEKCFLVHLRKWVDDQGILPEEQSGFRPGHNMAVRLVSMIDQIGQSLSKNTAAAALFVDFKSAFNQLWYFGLWIKLRRLECPSHIIAWLRKYLSGRSAYVEIKGEQSPKFFLFKGVPQGSCIGPVLFILYHYDILDSLTIIHWRHLFADDLSIVFSPSSLLSSSGMINLLAEQITGVLNRLIIYSTTWKQEINLKKTYWTLFHRQVSPRIPPIICNGYTIEHLKNVKYLGTHLDAKLSFTTHINYIKDKIRKNVNVFKRLTSSRMTSEKVNYRLFNAYIRPYYQSLFNIYPILTVNKQKQLEAMNRQIFRKIHQWSDATNIEIESLPKYKSFTELADTHWDNLTSTILRTNPRVLEDFLQHKLSIIYLKEYFTNPALAKEKRSIFDRGRTRNNIKSLLNGGLLSLFDHVLCF